MTKSYHKPLLTGSPARTIRRSDGLIEYRELATNHLLCLLDPRRKIIMIRNRGRDNRIMLDEGESISNNHLT